jgi:hypothetical protein
MSILLAIIGASVKWAIRGFKNSFKEELFGDNLNPKTRIPEDSNIYLGLATLFLFALIISLF